MGQAGAGRVGILVEGVSILIDCKFQLRVGGDGLLADGIKGIVQIDQGQVVGSDSHAQDAQRLGSTGLLLGG